MRASRLDLLARLDEINRVVIMLLDPGRHREDIGIEDDVLGRKTDTDEQFIGALADLDLARLCIRLPNLVERHHERLQRSI